MKKLFFSLAFCMVALIGAAQANKPVVTVEQFTGDPSSVAQILRQKVTSALQQAGRVNVVDVANNAQLKKEIERRKSELAMNDAGRVGDVSTLMSNGILKGSLDNATTTRHENVTKEGKREISYDCTVYYTLTLINAADGTTIKQQNFENKGYGATDKLALDAALNISVSPIKRFILNAYPVNGKVVAIDDADAKKAKTFYIDLGSADGLSKGQKVEVYKEVEIAGEKSQKLIGEATIQEVMSAGRSLCKVNKGGEVILKEMNSGTTLPVKTKEAKQNFFGSMFES